MIFTAFSHMFSVVFLRAYRKPRELTWLTGMFLLFLAMGFGFSGYLLPWNTLAFFATMVTPLVSRSRRFTKCGFAFSPTCNRTRLMRLENSSPFVG